MSWLYGQTWLWYLIAFLVGVLLAWLLFVLPAQRTLRQARAGASPAATGDPERSTGGAGLVGTAAVTHPAGDRTDDADPTHVAYSHVDAAHIDEAVTEQLPAVDPALSTLDSGFTGGRHSADVTAEIPIVKDPAAGTSGSSGVAAAALGAAGLGVAGVTGAGLAADDEHGDTDDATSVIDTAGVDTAGVDTAGVDTAGVDTAADGRSATGGSERDSSTGSAAGAGTLGAGALGLAAAGRSGDGDPGSAGDDSTGDDRGYTEEASAGPWSGEQDERANGGATTSLVTSELTAPRHAYAENGTRRVGGDTATAFGEAGTVTVADGVEATTGSDGSSAVAQPTSGGDVESHRNGHGNGSSPDAPFGPGSARPRSDGSAPGSEYTVKGNADSMLYLTPESPYYGRTVAEAWFSSAAHAEAAGFSPWTMRGSDTAQELVAEPAAPTFEPGPYPGSALPASDGSAPTPAFTIKGNASSMLYHTPESPYFGRTRAEAWFSSAQDADAAGFTAWRRK